VQEAIARGLSFLFFGVRRTFTAFLGALPAA
jgi:hypothetical protein